MTQSKHTKRALLTSVLAMLVCVAMLVGSTFAWFTDSVTSGRNRIVAGNLDVELEYWDGTSWQTVTENTNLFKPTEGANATLWEPGHTEYVQLRIRNAGTLALTYDFSVSVYGDENGGEEKEYTNMDGGKFELSDYLVFSKTNGVNTTGTIEREDLWLASADEEAAMGDLSGLAMNGELLTAGSMEEFTLAVYMPTSVGNAANQSTAARETEGAPTIYLGLTLLATQTPHENDSFGNDYDKAAAVTTENELREAVENGGTVVLFDDIELFTRLAVATETVLDLNGKTITFGVDYTTAGNTGASTDVTPIRVNAGGSLTITGNGTIDATAASDYVVPVSVMQSGGSVVIENGTIIVDTPLESCVFAMGGSVTINGGTFINNSTGPYGYGGGVPLNVSNGTPGTITVYGGTFVGRNPAEGDDNRQDLAPTFVAEGYTVASETQADGKIWYTVGKAANNAAALSTAIQDAKDGDTVIVTDNITSNNMLANLTTSKSVTIDLQGKTLVYNGSNRAVQVAYDGANLTIKNGAIQSGADGIMAFDGAQVTLENVDIQVTEQRTDNGAYSAVYMDTSITAELKNVNIQSAQIGVFSAGAGNDITIDGGTIESEYFGIYQNGSNSPVTVTVKNATVTDTFGNGIYISNSSADGREKQTLIIENSTISGPTAVEAKHTNVTIKDSNLIATAKPTGSGENGNGSCTSGYAFAFTTNSANDLATGNVVITNTGLYSMAEGQGGYCFVYQMADSYTASINGETVTEYNNYGGENVQP